MIISLNLYLCYIIYITCFYLYVHNKVFILCLFTSLFKIQFYITFVHLSNKTKYFYCICVSLHLTVFIINMHFFIELLININNKFCACTTISFLICDINLSIQFVKHGYVAHLFYTVNISCLNILQWFLGWWCGLNIMYP